MRGCEEVLVDVALHLATEIRSLDVRVPEVNPRPDARLEDLVGHVREAMEDALFAREPAARGEEWQLVGAEEGRERVHARGCLAAAGGFGFAGLRLRRRRLFFFSLITPFVLALVSVQVFLVVF